MLRSMLKSKIHRATVTDANINYAGSLTLDRNLMEAADLLPCERVMVYNITNGERFDTYIITGERGSGTVCINGAAARKANIGDLIIIASYASYSEDELGSGGSRIVILGENNTIDEERFELWTPED